MVLRFRVALIVLSITSAVLSFTPNETVQFKFNGCLKLLISNIIGNDTYNVLIAPDKYPESILRGFEDLVFIRTTPLEMESCLAQLHFNPSTYIIPVDNIDVFNATLASLVSCPLYSSHSILLIITENRSLAQVISEEMWKFKLIRAYLLVLGRGEIELSTIELVECGARVRPKKVLNLNRTNNCIFVTPKIDLKSVLKGCPLYIITGSEPPFVNSENDTLKGIFIEMIEVFGNVHQREIVIRPYDSIYMDEIVESYNFNTMIADFESGYADIFLGAIQLSAIEVMDVGPLIVPNDLMFLVPRKFINGPIDLLFSLSNFEHLACLLIEIAMVLIVFNIIVRFTVDRNIFGSLFKTWLLFFGIILNVATLPRIPKNRIVRYFLICMLFLTMLCTTYLQGILISILNGPFYEPPIKSLVELLHKDVPIKLTPLIAFFFQYTASPYFKEIYEKHHVLNAKDLFEAGDLLLEKKNFATGIYRGFHIMRPNIKKSFSTFPFWINAHTVGMPKNYYMHKEFYEWFTQMLEHGILAKFSKVYEFTYALQYFVDTESRIYKVTMKQFEPAIVVLIVGYLVSFFAFLMEILVYKVKENFKSNRNRKSDEKL